MAEGNGNDTIKTREFYKALIEMENRLNEKLEPLAPLCNQVKNNTEEIKSLRNRSNILDAGTALLAIIAGAIGLK